MSGLAAALNFTIPQGEAIDTRGMNFAGMDALLLRDGRMNCLAAPVYHQLFSQLELRAWCCLRGRYQLPTTELCQWLQCQIAGRTALEIGAGCGDLGRLLNIPMTDSHQQVAEQSTVEYLRLYGVTPTRPPADVIKQDAENAVRVRKPQVVIGCWITEKWLECSTPEAGGNLFGPREDYILERCETYIMVGNEAIHGRKRLLAKPHQVFKFPWLMSRAKDPDKNVIYVWHNERPWR